ALNARRAARLLDWSLVLSAALAEVMRARSSAWHPTFAVVRPHPGQQLVTERLNRLTAGTGRLRDDPPAKASADVDPGILQDAYTLRCVPQVLGAVADLRTFHDALVLRELNAVTDNPIFPEAPDPAVLHGGNFQGQHVAAASDALAIGLVTLAGLAERQIARVTDERLNGGLPPFLCRGRPGLDSGLMGAQVTATALLAEMRSRAVPASIQSISTNGANQDVVSMGTIAARNAAAQASDAATILAILALACAQGIDICGPDGFSPAALALHGAIRVESAPLLTDRPLAAEIEAVAGMINRNGPPCA
ncbi:MAG: aromatic amino acid ammonia-lyase, partial [Pseudomonadota bacterium]